jgi:hypothetical protein
MPTATNASSYTQPTTLTGATLLGRVSNRWRNFATTLFEPSTRRVSHKTADYAMLAAETGTYFTNLGAGAAINFTLPTATVGLRYTFSVRATQRLRVYPNGTDVIENTATPRVYQSVSAHLWADAVGESLEVICLEAGKWAVHDSAGTWTVA